MRSAKAPAADELSAPPDSQAVSQGPAFSFRLQRRVGRTLLAWTNKHRTSVTLASLVAGALALGLIALVAVRAYRGPAVHVVTSAVTEGPITRTVMTTGTLAPAKTVDVGTQVSGTIEQLSADFNSRVRAGDLLARLDPRPFDAEVMQATAAVAQSEGDLARLRIVADDARVKLARARSLASTELITPAELDAARVAAEQAAADVKAGGAAVQSARARLEQARTNRAHAIIRSPIDGVVVNRLVEVGQTVNAAVNAPILFTIADLRHMLLLGEINEGEIGAVRPGAPVTFVIESHARQQHTGTVNEVRLQPVVDTTATSSTAVATSGASATGGTAVGTVGTSSASGSTNAPAAPGGTQPPTSPSTQARTSQATTNTPAVGVVTYTAVVDVENPDGAYVPGETGLMTFVGDHRDRAIRIPNNALTFRPPVDLLKSLGQQEPPVPQQDSKDPRPGRLTRVWTFKDGRFDAVTVRVGLANDSWTELLEGPVRPGDQLVTQAATK
jgi:HlyD family secretion protein